MAKQRPKAFDRMLEAHYRQYYDTLVRQYSRGVLHAVAEEIVQEGYTRALEQWENYDGTSTFSTWFGSKILPAAAQQASRAERRHGGSMSKDADVDTNTIEVASAIDAAQEDAALLRQLRQKISAMPSPQREVLNDVLLEQESPEAAARRAGFTHGGVRNMVSKFREGLKREGWVL